MDSVPQKIAFSFHDLSLDGPGLTEPWQAYLRIVGDFEMKVSASRIYAEEQFCLVEFAIQSQIWSRTAALNAQDFSYTSIEAEESGLVWFRMEQGGWNVGSVFQDRPCLDVLTLAEIVAALDDYYQELRRAVRKQFEVDIAVLFEWLAVQRASGTP